MRQVVGGERLRCLVAHTGSGVAPELTHQSQEGDAGAGEGRHVQAVGRQVLMGRGGGGDFASAVAISRPRFMSASNVEHDRGAVISWLLPLWFCRYWTESHRRLCPGRRSRAGDLLGNDIF